MELYQNEPIVTKITAVVFVPAGSGAPVHTNRRAHGLAYYTNHSSTFRFSDGTVITCHSGQCIYLPMGCSYTVDRSDPSADPSAGIHAINFLLEQPLAERPFVMNIRSQTGFLSAYEHARTAWRQKYPGYRELCFSQLYSLLSLAMQDRQEYAQSSRTAQLLAPALEYIHRQFTHQEVTSAQLAEMCGVSEQYLRRLFHSAFGMPPARYVRHKRLMYARELLRTGEYTVAAAAAAAGFNDAAYFSREFRKTFGSSPIQYSKSG